MARYLALQPDGWFGAMQDTTLIGMGGALSYGEFASIGMMAVDPWAQRRGIGRAILENVLVWLHSQGCDIAMLDASTAGVPLYVKRGFLDDGATILFQSENEVFHSAPTGRVSSMTRVDVPDVSKFDAPLFGADRTAVLSSYMIAVPDRAFLTRNERGDVTGYLIAQSQHLGPWAADTPQDAEALLGAALSLSFSGPPIALVPSANRSAQSLLSRFGFSRQRALRHMYLGPEPPSQDRSRIYGQASFAIG